MRPKRSHPKEKVCACITNFTASLTAPVPLTADEEELLSQEAESNGMDEEQIMECSFWRNDKRSKKIT